MKIKTWKELGIYYGKNLLYGLPMFIIIILAFWLVISFGSDR